ncbi:MAG: LamG domain-containing protein, partial [Proteobacteria bacterium]|nr:LamG domain-containing protein [Pseudomonadota bacterium]
VTVQPGAAMSGIWTLREAQEGHSAQQWPPFYDPFLSSVSLAVNFEGSFSDQSANAYTVTANGGASISSATSAIGTRSGLFVSSSSQYASVSGGLIDGLNPLIFGTSNFCLEAWVYPTSYTRSSQSVSDVNFDYFFISNSNGGLHITNSHNARFGAAAFFNNQSTTVSLSGANNAVPVNAWTHIAYAREGSTGRLFVNGVQVATTTDSTNYSSAHSLVGGRGFAADTRYFNGYLDGVRITKGAARYTSSFTPPRVLATK